MIFSWHLYSESVTRRSRIYGWSTSNTPTCVAWLIISQLKRNPELFVIKLENYSEPMHQDDRYQEGSPDPIRSKHKVWSVPRQELTPEVLEKMLDWATNQFTPMQLLKDSLFGV